MARRRRSRALLAALLLLASLTLPADGSSATLEPLPCGAPSGDLLLQGVSALGRTKAGVTVMDPATGGESGEFDTPPIDAAFPTALPGRALAVAGQELFLLDAQAMSAEAIRLPGSARDLAPNPVQFRGTAGTRYLLLGSPSFDRTYLIDAEAGVATDLGALVVAGPEASVFVQFAAVTPDDAHVVLWDGSHVYLVETAAPEAATRVDAADFAFGPAFSPDGSELIFSESAGPGSGSTLVLQDLDGRDRRERRASDRAQVPLWVPGGRTVLIDERTETGAASGTATLLDLDSGAETRMLDYEGSLTTVQFTADGRRALLGVESFGNAIWRLADLESGAVEELPRIGSGRALPGLYAHARWSLVLPLDASGTPLGGPAFRGVDLESGAVGRLLDIDPSATYPGQPALSRDGRYGLVTSETAGRQTLWLLDAKELRTRELATAQTVGGIFAPDGCHVAVSQARAVDGLPSWSTEIVAATGGKGTDAGSGRVLAWVLA